MVGGEDNPLFLEEYASGFKVDSYYRFHGITGDELDQLFLQLWVSRLRNDYGPYRGKKEGTETPDSGPPSTISLPYSKGATDPRSGS